MQARASRAVGQKILGRYFHNGRAAGAQVPAVSQASSGGIFGAIFGPKSVPLPSMYEPLAGVPVVPPTTAPVSTETAVTVLPNGLTIASEDKLGPTATIGVFVNSGSVYETPFNSGVSNLLERMAYKSTSNRTHFRVVREIEAIGGNFLSSASREQMVYTADVIKAFVPEAVEMLADTVRNSVYNEWEVSEAAKRLAADVTNLQAKNPQSMMLEALHSAGFAGALGQPLVAHPTSLMRLDGQALFDFVSSNYTAPRIVVAASGVPHDAFKNSVESLFLDLPTVSATPAPASQYVGGDFRMASDTAATHVALGFEVQGGWRNEKDSAAVIVLQTLLGGGSSFSAGGPGKGMYSRLYKRVLNKYTEVQSCTAFTSIYNDTGLFGIYATSGSGFVTKLVDVVTEEFTSVASGGVTEQELQRAKNATVASVLMNLESRAVAAEDIGRQILTYGHRKSTESFLASVNALTVKDITSLAQKLLKTPLSLATLGDVVHVPRYDAIAKRFT